MASNSTHAVDNVRDNIIVSYFKNKNFYFYIIFSLNITSLTKSKFIVLYFIILIKKKNTIIVSRESIKVYLKIFFKLFALLKIHKYSYKQWGKDFFIRSTVKDRV